MALSSAILSLVLKNATFKKSQLNRQTARWVGLGIQKVEIYLSSAVEKNYSVKSGRRVEPFVLPKAQLSETIKM